jgi:RNA recognition motif-containing protein
MMSWADHCSSDEEDATADDHHHDNANVESEADKMPEDPETLPVSPDEMVPIDTMAGSEVAEERVYEFPTQPPFTAFIGNLSYQIKDPDMLVEAVSSLAQERLQEPVNVVGGRVAYHRSDPHGKHRGFGYVEVETLEQVSLGVCS